ncbi:hypothetical protein CAEBREN_15795 [Caenorhabditis brenneri]|uniref:Uncharacterized protein n=1 Tax=Caenorhabditis brenneri TaxID=135651 RepID=G0M8G1_CAEBE|nr:hypothetical protein CAEBREN_15795 [Caenorhabditis brenneri]
MNMVPRKTVQTERKFEYEATMRTKQPPTDEIEIDETALEDIDLTGQLYPYGGCWFTM